MNKAVSFLAVLGLLCSFNSFAGSDPVAWSVSPATGFPPTQVGEQSIVQYSFTNRLPFAVQLVMETEVTGGNFSLQDECHNQMLAPNNTCLVIVAFNPASTKVSTFRLIYGYNKNRIPLPLLTANPGTGPSSPLHGVIRGLPPSFYVNSTVDFYSVYTNTGQTTLTGCTFGNFTSSGVPATLAPIVTVGECTNGQSLGQGQSCELRASVLSGGVPGLLTISQLATCSDAGTPVSANPRASSLVRSSTGCVVHASVDLPLPQSTYKYADNVVRFRFENECPVAVNLTPVTFSAQGGTATITPAASSTSLNTCGSTLGAGNHCDVTASVIPTSVTNSLIITASTSSPGKGISSAKTSAPVVTNQQSTHHIVFVNQCKFNVWYGIANGGNQNCPGAACQTQDPNLTAYPQGAPPSAYLLTGQTLGNAPSTIDLSVASYQNGAFWPRTGCTFNGSGSFVCTTGACQTMPNTATCVSSGALVQPQSPYTKFEATLNLGAGTDGIYDVSAVNGMTVPVEVKAFGPSTGNTASTVYNCSAAGALIQPPSNNSLGNCSWEYNPAGQLGAGANNDFYWVTSGADNGCNTSTPPSLCGEAWNSGPDGNGTYSAPINRREGSFLGFNTLDVYSAYAVIGTNNGTWGSVNLFTKYGLNQQISGQTPSDNYGTIPNQVFANPYLANYALISCPVVTSNGSLNSCYQPPTNNNYANCCGCVNWTNTLPSAQCGSLSQGGYQTGMNLDWTTNTIPIVGGGNYTPQQAVTWIKNACPTAYAYTYDDPSSSFSCTQDEGVNLNTSYQVTFCPGEVSALPAGVTDGRPIPPP